MTISVLPMIRKYGTAPKLLYLNGAWAPASSGKKFDQLHPATNEIAGSFELANEADINQAVAAARDAFTTGPWSRMKARERRKLIQKISEVIEKNAQDLAYLQTLDNGVPINFSLNTRISANNAADIFDHYAGWADKINGEVFAQYTSGADMQFMTFREPVGVVGAIIPWNAPLMMFAMKVAPALATGCTVVLKPSELANLGVLHMVNLIHEHVDLPPGVLNIVTGAGETGSHLVNHSDVAKVTFTGSKTVGQYILSRSGEGIKRVTLELGGKSAALVFPDCRDVGKVSSMVMGLCSTFLSGQVCSTTSRALVHEKIYDEFIAGAQKQVESVKFGDPFDLTTTSAPMISRKQQKKVLDYIESGKSEGARLVFGGEVPGANLANGNWITPALFADVDNKMRIAQEEIFGPVLSVIPFKTEDEAIAIANDSEYGLSGAVYTTDISRAIRVARAMHTGSIGVNGYGVMPNSPSGGVKNSGIGREGGWSTIEAFTELKTVIVNVSG